MICKGYSRKQRKRQFYLEDSYGNQTRVGTDENVLPSLRVGILDLEVDDRVVIMFTIQFVKSKKRKKNISHIIEQKSV